MVSAIFKALIRFVMRKKTAILCTVLLAASVALFVVYNLREYQERDTLGPIIDMNSPEIYVSVSDPESQLLYGMTAKDAEDGDVTGSILVESISNFIEEDTRIVRYAAFDSSNNVTKASRRLIYTDYTPIVFTLDAPLRFPVSAYSRDYLSVLHARDCLDGDISDRVVFSADSVINTNTAADYQVTLEVTNSAGEIFRLPVTVTLYSPYEVTDAPTITLTNYLVYIGQGEALDPMEYLKSVTYRNKEYTLTNGQGTFAVDTEDWTREELEEFREREPEVNRDLFEITNLVNSDIPGTYEVEYTLDDLDGNRGRVRLVVVVEEENT